MSKVTLSWFDSGSVARYCVDICRQLCALTMVIGRRLIAEAMLAITVVSSRMAVVPKELPSFRLKLRLLEVYSWVVYC